MQIQFIRNIQFTKLVKAEGRLREFNFRKSNGLQEGLFTVDVSDDRGNRIVLRMQREDGVWKIIKQQLPAWIWENEAVFHTLIEEELGCIQNFTLNRASSLHRLRVPPAENNNSGSPFPTHFLSGTGPGWPRQIRGIAASRALYLFLWPFHSW
jgi:hypothetical protein